MIADPPADSGEGIVFFNDPQGVLVAPFMDEGDVALGPLAGRAGIPAGGDASLLDGESIGYGLRVKLEAKRGEDGSARLEYQ